MSAVARSDIGLPCITAMAVGFALGTAHSAPQWWAWLIRLILVVNFLRVFFRATK